MAAQLIDPHLATSSTGLSRFVWKPCTTGRLGRDDRSEPPAPDHFPIKGGRRPAERILDGRNRLILKDGRSRREETSTCTSLFLRTLLRGYSAPPRCPVALGPCPARAHQGFHTKHGRPSSTHNPLLTQMPKKVAIRDHPHVHASFYTPYLTPSYFNILLPHT